MKSRTFAIVLLISTSFTFAGCGEIEFIPSPESVGREAGEYFAEEWNSTNSGTLPPVDMAAYYCADIATAAAKDYNFDFQDQIKVTDACTLALGNGLD